MADSARDRATEALLVARCENVTEPDGIPCPGRLRYRWGQGDAACDTCGGRCGIAVANWERVEPDGLRALAGEAEEPDTPPADDAPAVWWSPSLAAVNVVGLVWWYVSGEGWITRSEPPGDAVRLVPVAATTPPPPVGGELHGVAIAEGGGGGCWKTYCPACSWAAGEWVTVCAKTLVARTWPAETVLRPVPAAATTPAGEIEIDGHDLSTALFPAPGQLGNENPSGVILRHAPTGIEVSCSSERSALQNKVQALAELRAVLARRTEETTS